MTRRRLLRAFAAALAGAALATAWPAGPARAAGKAPPPAPAGASPEAVVRNLYDRYAAGAFDYMTDRRLAARTFTAATAGLLARAFAKSKKLDEPGIDYEPLIDGQDGEVKGLTVATTAATTDKATVTATFKSFDETLTVTFEFRREKGVWRVEDIRGREGTSLRGVAKAFLGE
ncbi:DUF3828 domain-containing protein [Prosthecomicrobium sp. N25]|uniref:DUF3828 domain-containing protein n=1 Tax=Prosthecomicrobium sp. N25 TaxID=3129254 RepID=UPI0030785784